MPWKDQLAFAVNIKDYHTVDCLLRDGQSPNGRLDGQASLLHLAIRNNDIRMTKLLVDHNADVNLPDNKGQTPLFISSDPTVDTRITRVLLSAGAKPDTKGPFDRTPLHKMSFFLQNDKISLLLKDTNAAFLNAQDFFGNTALHMCVTSDNPNHKHCVPTLRCLLKAGADPDIQDSQGKSILHHVSDKYAPLTDSLFAERPNVKFQTMDRDGETFLHKLVRNLVLTEEYWFELFGCSSIRKHEWRTLLNLKSLCGQTPFFIYLDLQFYHESVIFKMLELGADSNLSDNLGVTPLMRACTFSFETTRVLIESGADVNAQNIYGQTALHLAKDSEMALYMIKSGAHINICDKWNRSPFQQSILSALALNTTDDIQKVMVAVGACINHQDIYGSTALHLAACGNYELITCLLELGADPQIKDANGRVPLDVARRHHNQEAEELLQASSQIDQTELDTTICTEKPMHKNVELLRVFQEVQQVCNELNSDEGSKTRTSFQKVKCAVEELMKNIAAKVEEIDCSFAIEVFSSGSLYEGTKAEKPDEFDFVYCLPFFAESCDIVESSADMSFGLVRLQSKSALPPIQVAHLFDDNGYVSARKLRKELEGLIQRVIRTKDTWDISNIKMGGLALSFEKDNLAEKPVLNFKISFIDKEYSNLDISIDVALGIRKSGWWPSYIKVDEIPLVDDTINRMGCIVIAQVPGDKSTRDKMLSVVSMNEDGQVYDGLVDSTSEDDTFAIRAEHVSAYSDVNAFIMKVATEPDETDDKASMEMVTEGNPDFRISCSLCESYAMGRLPQTVKNGYILAKILKERICPDIDFKEGNNTKLIEQLLFSSAKDFIKSYLLKNCLFHILSSDVEIIYMRDRSDLSSNSLLHMFSSDETFYTRDKYTSVDKTQQVADVAIAIYRYLSRAATQKAFPSHFLPMVDLFKYQRLVLEGCSAEDFDEYLKDTTYKINMYCQPILGCLRCFDKQTS